MLPLTTVVVLGLLITIHPISFPWTKAAAVQAASQTDADAIYEDGDEGVTAPRLVREVRPNYTGTAMAVRIEGVLGLDCVVELDGTVSAVRILHHLDPQRRLDAEGVKALRQWRFMPAQKDGKPVRFRAVVEMSFSLRGSFKYPTLEWPDGFAKKTGNAKRAAAGFASQTASAQGLRVRVLHPRDWVVAETAGPDELLSLHRQSGQDIRRVAVFVSSRVTSDIITPLSDPALAAVAKYVKKQIAGDPNGTELLKVGQVWTYDRQWIWADTRQRVSAEAGDMSGLFEDMRVWTFTTTEAGHEVRVLCSVYIPRGLAKREREAFLLRATGDFQVILDRLAIDAN
jgi:TonB family protein